MTQGVGHADLVGGNAPPHIDTGITRPCTVSLDRENLTGYQQKQQIFKFNIKPCTVHLQTCLSQKFSENFRPVVVAGVKPAQLSKPNQSLCHLSLTTNTKF